MDRGAWWATVHVIAMAERLHFTSLHDGAGWCHLRACAPRVQGSSTVQWSRCLGDPHAAAEEAEGQRCRGLGQVHGWKQTDMDGAKACLSPAPV